MTDHIPSSWLELAGEVHENRRCSTPEQLVRSVLLAGEDDDSRRDTVRRMVRTLTAPTAPYAALALLGLATLAEASGWALEDVPPVPQLLRTLAARQGPWKGAAVWAHLAYGKGTGFAKLLPVKVGDEVPAREARIGTDEGILLHFVRCVKHRVEADVARPAWDRWLLQFPILIAMPNPRYASWLVLLFAARAMHVVLEQAPADTTLDWLRRQLSTVGEAARGDLLHHLADRLACETTPAAICEPLFPLAHSAGVIVVVDDSGLRLTFRPPIEPQRVEEALRAARGAGSWTIDLRPPASNPDGVEVIQLVRS